MVSSMVSSKGQRNFSSLISKLLICILFCLLLVLFPTTAKAIDVVDNLVYFPSGANGLQIYDVSDWHNPVLLNEEIVAVGASDVHVAESYAYVTNGNSLIIVDISDPRNPQETGRISTSWAHDVWVDGDFAYVAAWRNDVVVVDVSNPANPTFAGKLPVTDRALGVQVQNNLAFVVDNRDKGVRIFDVTNPRAAVQIGFAVRGGTHEGLYVAGDRLYVASADTAGIHIFDISDPTNPIHLSEHNTPGYARNVYVEHDIAYVADQYGDVRVLDVSDPRNIREITWHETPGEVWNVTGGNGVIYVSDSVAGLIIIPQESAPEPLPGDSGNIGPPLDPIGQVPDLCCMAGYLYYQGVPLPNPAVTITDNAGNQVTAAIDTKNLHHAFTVDFAETTLAVQVGDPITLTAGAEGLPDHIVTYVVKGGPQQVDIVMPSPTSYTRPIATLNRRTHIGEADINDRLIFEGSGQDSDETPAISAYEWRSSLVDEPLSSESSLIVQPNELAVGLHQISFRVQDGEGEWSQSIRFPMKIRESIDGWTIFLYLAGDYNDNGYLQRQFGRVIETFNRPGNTLAPDVNVLLLTDSYGNGNTTLNVYSGTPITKSIRTGACQEIQSEMPMDKPQTLTTFLDCGRELFGETHTYLSIADHGHGIFGTAWDHSSPEIGDGGAVHSSYLPTTQIDDALRASTVGKVDILHLDSCSMNLLETAYELNGLVDYFISSQYLTWADFSYYRYITDLNGEELPLQFARPVAERYVNSVTGGRPYTLSILRLQDVTAVQSALSELAGALLAQVERGQLTVATLDAARLQTQVFESAYVDQYYALEQEKDFYIDLVDWTQHILAIEGIDAQTRGKAELLLSYLGPIANFIVENHRHSGTMPLKFGGQPIDLAAAHGVSLFYPVNDPWNLLEQYVNDERSAFIQTSQWDEFLQAVSVQVGSPDGESVELPVPVAPLDLSNQIFLPLILQQDAMPQ